MVVSRAATEAPSPLQPTLIPVPGTADLGAAGTLLAEEADPAGPRGEAGTAVIDADRVRGTLTVSGPRAGDRLQVLGMRGSKKVSDILVDDKVPRRERSSVPVVRDEPDVVWVAGLRLSERYKVTAKTTRALRLTWRPADGAGVREGTADAP